MRVVIQRVSKAEVSIGKKERSSVGAGLLVLAGFEDADTAEDIEWICNKIVQLRIFNDNEGVMNLSVMETGGSIMVVSQFTLHAKTKKGNRPSYIRAARPEKAIPLYNLMIDRLDQLTGRKTESGEFAADMAVSLVNEGPVTIIIDTKNRE